MSVNAMSFCYRYSPPLAAVACFITAFVCELLSINNQSLLPMAIIGYSLGTIIFISSLYQFQKTPDSKKRIQKKALDRTSPSPQPASAPPQLINGVEILWKPKTPLSPENALQFTEEQLQKRGPPIASQPETLVKKIERKIELRHTLFSGLCQLTQFHKKDFIGSEREVAVKLWRIPAIVTKAKELCAVDYAIAVDTLNLCSQDPYCAISHHGVLLQSSYIAVLREATPINEKGTTMDYFTLPPPPAEHIALLFGGPLEDFRLLYNDFCEKAKGSIEFRVNYPRDDDQNVLRLKFSFL